MSGLFSTPKSPNIPKQEPIEEVTRIEETAEESRRRKRKSLQAGGRRSTILSGITSVLKKRLGE